MKGKTIIISIHKNLIDDLADEIYQIDSGNFTKNKVMIIKSKNIDEVILSLNFKNTLENIFHT